MTAIHRTPALIRTACRIFRPTRAPMGLGLVFACALLAFAPMRAVAAEPDAPDFARIEAILTQDCTFCHSGPNPGEGYDLTSHATITSPRDWLRVVPGSPDASELIRRVRGQARPAMPLNAPPLAGEDTLLFESWVRDGARDGSGAPAPLPSGARVRLHGTLDAMWSLDGLPLTVPAGARIDDNPGIGDYVQVRGWLDSRGEVVVDRMRLR